MNGDEGENVIKSECKTNIFLANCIWLFHMIIILFVLFAPFCNIPCILLLHITFCLSLFVHWYGNSNICSLSVMEAKLRGLDYTQSFSHKFIAPVYEITNTEWSMIVWLITICVLLLSAYKMYYSGKISEFQEYYSKNKIELSQTVSNISIIQKIKLFVRCFQIVFFST